MSKLSRDNVITIKAVKGNDSFFTYKGEPFSIPIEGLFVVFSVALVMYLIYRYISKKY